MTIKPGDLVTVIGEWPARPWRVLAVVPSLGTHSAIPIYDVQIEPAYEAMYKGVWTLRLSQVEPYAEPIAPI